jgi:branched-subunit amino acid ABC-type transport system permease component
MAVLLLAVMRRTAFGRNWRAIADDPLAASLFGVDGRRVFAATFALAAALAGVAGFVMTAYYGGVGYGAGLVLGLKALVAAVLGGIGSVGGALLGGLAIGLAEALWSATMPIESRDIAVFVLLSVVLALRPGGLRGFGDLLPRRV